MSLILHENTGEFISEHEVVLQVLEDDDIPGIEAELSTIPGEPIPFSVKHPEGGFKDKNQETVFNQDIKSAGIMGDGWIDYTGRPKLKAKINITDPEIENLIKTGKVFVSDAYWHDPTSLHISSFNFDHLLIYPRDSRIPQGEPAALIINQSTEENTEDIMTTVDQSTKEIPKEPTSLEYANSLLKTNQVELVEKEKMILTLNQEIANKDHTIVEQTELIKNQTSAIEDLNKRLDDIEKTEKLKTNQALFASYPEGIQKKFESRISELENKDSANKLVLEMNKEWAKIPSVLKYVGRFMFKKNEK